MTNEKVVLWKTRRRRSVEMLALSAVLFSIGPGLRAVFGQHYSMYGGLLLGLVVMVLAPMVGNRLAPRFGGEWVLPAERLRRLLAENSATPRWQTAVHLFFTVALTLSPILLISAPLSSLVDAVGGAGPALGFVVGVPSAVAALAMIAKRERPPFSINETAPPNGRFWSELCRATAVAWGAALVGVVAGFAIASQLTPPWATIAFIFATFLAYGFALRVGAAKRSKEYFPNSRPTLFRHVAMGVLLQGVPFGAVFCGVAIVSDTVPAGLLQITVCLAGGIVFGVLSGLFRHVLQLVDRRQGIA